MPAPLYLTGPCQICDQPAHGRHFGVMSCRACAAFFRRTAVKNLQKSNGETLFTIVKNGKPTSVSIDTFCLVGNCQIYKNGKYYCKKCRLKKCYDKGMDAKKFQMDRDPLSSTSTFLKRTLTGSPQSLSNFLGRPEFILCCEPDRASHVKTLIDVSYLIDKAVKIFGEIESFSEVTPYKFKNSLGKLSYLTETNRSKQSNQKLDLLRTVGKSEALFFWEQEFLGAARWLAGISEFTGLDMNVKIDILKSAWILWIRLEKLSETAYHHKTKNLGDELFICGENTCMDMTDFQIDLKWCTNYSIEQMKFYIMPDTEKDWKECVNDLLELDPTNVELNFMLLHLCLHDAGKRHQGKVLEATERILQIQSDNLHDYYTKTQKMSHYSGRLTKLMKVNKSIELDSRMRREKNHIARVFDIFSIDFSHPEMFELT